MNASHLLLVGGQPAVESAQLRTADEAEIFREIAGASRRGANRRLAERAKEVTL